eukprot:3284507-Alexandrium_andersonii.AAC.1
MPVCAYVGWVTARSVLERAIQVGGWMSVHRTVERRTACLVAKRAWWKRTRSAGVQGWRGPVPDIGHAHISR